MSIKIDKIKLKDVLAYIEKADTGGFSTKIDRVSETYTTGEEKTKYTKSGHGSTNIVNDGDGDASIVTRVYADGVLKESIDGNVFAIIFVYFTTSLSIRTYRATAGTGYCSTISVVGFSRVA